MIHIFDGTVFNAGAQALVNTINTTGAMGAGIALEFKLRYPDMYDDYKAKCDEKKLHIGSVDYYQDPDGTIICNFPTKAHYAYPSRIEWIEQGLKSFAETFKEHNVTSAAFPKLGCSNGGLKWEQVKPLMMKYLDLPDIEIYICEDTVSEAQGVEQQMVDKYNENLRTLDKLIKLTDKQIEALDNNGKVRRFWQISKIEGVTPALYKKIFEFFYAKCKPKEPVVEEYGQISLFGNELKFASPVEPYEKNQ